MGTQHEVTPEIQYQIDLAESLMETKAQYRKIIKAGIAQWVKDFQAGNIQIKTVDDLKKLIEIDIELQKDE
jgi:hypothetical protein